MLKFSDSGRSCRADESHISVRVDITGDMVDVERLIGGKLREIGNATPSELMSTRF